MPVSAVEVQDTLCALPDVRFAAVTMNAKIGAWMVAVVPWGASSIDMSRCRQTLAARYPRVSALIASCDAVTLTAQGKIDRRALERFVQEHAE